jgi:hypothetical protein
MHVHLVFVAKYRRRVFTEASLADLRVIFTSVCEDFEAELIEMDGEDDHVHLLVNYPPKVAVSVLVNSLKGCPADAFGRCAPNWCGGIGRESFGPRPTSPHPVAERHSASSANTSNSSGRPNSPCRRRRASNALTSA